MPPIHLGPSIKYERITEAQLRWQFRIYLASRSLHHFKLTNIDFQVPTETVAQNIVTKENAASGKVEHFRHTLGRFYFFACSEILISHFLSRRMAQIKQCHFARTIQQPTTEIHTQKRRHCEDAEDAEDAEDDDNRSDAFTHSAALGRTRPMRLCAMIS